MDTDLRALAAQARGGRVVRTGFVNADEINRRALAAEGVRFAVHGGFADPARVVYTLYPEHVPAVDDPVRVLRLTGDFPRGFDAQDLLVALDLPDDARGDVRDDGGSFLVATNARGAKLLGSLGSVRGPSGLIGLEVEPVAAGSLERSNRTRTVVVPSTRVDVVGAKGFGVSRSYFQAGVQGGKVRVNGALASSSTEVREGDTLVAEGLGRIEFKRVIGETRRGNYKLELEVHR